MAIDELTAILNRDNIALRAALKAATHYPEAWHAASNANLVNGRNDAVSEVLTDSATAVLEKLTE